MNECIFDLSFCHTGFIDRTFMLNNNNFFSLSILFNEKKYLYGETEEAQRVFDFTNVAAVRGLSSSLLLESVQRSLESKRVHKRMGRKAQELRYF